MKTLDNIAGKVQELMNDTTIKRAYTMGEKILEYINNQYGIEYETDMITNKAMLAHLKKEYPIKK